MEDMVFKGERFCQSFVRIYKEDKGLRGDRFGEGARRREAGGRRREPGAGRQEPEARSREPGAGRHEPGAGSREAGDRRLETGDGRRETGWGSFGFWMEDRGIFVDMGGILG